MGSIPATLVIIDFSDFLPYKRTARLIEFVKDFRAGIRKERRKVRKLTKQSSLLKNEASSIINTKYITTGKITRTLFMRSYMRLLGTPGRCSKYVTKSPLRKLRKEVQSQVAVAERRRVTVKPEVTTNRTKHKISKEKGLATKKFPQKTRPRSLYQGPVKTMHSLRLIKSVMFRKLITHTHHVLSQVSKFPKDQESRAEVLKYRRVFPRRLKLLNGIANSVNTLRQEAEEFGVNFLSKSKKSRARSKHSILKLHRSKRATTTRGYEIEYKDVFAMSFNKSDLKPEQSKVLGIDNVVVQTLTKLNAAPLINYSTYYATNRLNNLLLWTKNILQNDLTFYRASQGNVSHTLANPTYIQHMRAQLFKTLPKMWAEMSRENYSTRVLKADPELSIHTHSNELNLVSSGIRLLQS